MWFCVVYDLSCPDRVGLSMPFLDLLNWSVVIISTHILIKFDLLIKTFLYKKFLYKLIIYIHILIPESFAHLFTTLNIYST